MKNLKSKKLNKRIDTIYDFNRGLSMPASSETDPTAATMTIVITTVNTHTTPKKLM